MTQRFNGVKFANELKAQLKPKVDLLIKQGRQPHIASLVFREDETGRLYTNLKQVLAQELGMIYQPKYFSFVDNVKFMQDEIVSLNQDSQVTGVMIQKPTRKLWLVYQSIVKLNENANRKSDERKRFDRWWVSLANLIDIKKDVDGLNPQTLEAIKQGSDQRKRLVPPATAKAVLKILHNFIDQWPEKKIAIIGASDLVGKPLYYLLSPKMTKGELKLLTRQRLQAQLKMPERLRKFDIIISATGRPRLINASMVSNGVALIDVGEPEGDINPNAYQKASFYTPVPGGVGPVTVVSLMENAIHLLSQR